MSHRFCSTRIRSHPLARFALYRMVGSGGGYTRTILGSLGSNLQQPGQPESRFIFSVLLRSSVCFGVTLSEWPKECCIGQGMRRCIKGMGKPQWDSKRLTWGAWANCCWASQVATDVKFVHVGINKVHLSDCIGTWCIQYTLLFEIS